MLGISISSRESCFVSLRLCQHKIEFIGIHLGGECLPSTLYFAFSFHNATAATFLIGSMIVLLINSKLWHQMWLSAFVKPSFLHFPLKIGVWVHGLTLLSSSRIEPIKCCTLQTRGPGCYGREQWWAINIFLQKATVLQQEKQREELVERSAQWALQLKTWHNGLKYCRPTEFMVGWRCLILRDTWKPFLAKSK